MCVGDAELDAEDNDHMDQSSDGNDRLLAVNGHGHGHGHGRGHTNMPAWTMPGVHEWMCIAVKVSLTKPSPRTKMRLSSSVTVSRTKLPAKTTSRKHRDTHFTVGRASALSSPKCMPMNVCHSSCPSDALSTHGKRSDSPAGGGPSTCLTFSRCF